MDKTKIEHHIKHLQEKHDDHDRRISLDREPHYIMTVLKKEKLQMKDEIERLRHKIQ